MSTRLLAGVQPGRPLRLDEHLAVHGPLPDTEPGRLIEAAERAGLTGRGGGGFPMARKLAAVAEHRGAKVVVANGVEAEPMSAKDRVLLAGAPHVVLDGIGAAAAAVGARDAIVCVPAGAPTVQSAVEHAIRERRAGRHLRIRVTAVPSRYLAGEETALVRHLDGGPIKPTFTPPRPSDRGVGRRPTLVQNVETLAHLALVARHGPGWFRSAGTATAPGTMLVTLAGGLRRRGVLEVAGGTRLADVLAHGETPAEELSGLIVGGYFGAWLPASLALELSLDGPELARHGAALGAGVLIAMPGAACGVSELARVMAWLAAQSAHQCGPCANGLPAIAGELARLAAGQGSLDRVLRWARMVDGRGACGHPDGAARLVTTAVRALEPELRDHERHGRCTACAEPPLLATPGWGALAA